MSGQTRIAIRDAFLKLLSERPLSKITVRDITNECGINRNSFYYHYPDIPTLIEEIFSEELSRIILEHPNISSLEDCVITAANFASQNRQVIRHIYSFHTLSFIMSLNKTVELYFETVYPSISTPSEEWNGLMHMLSCLCYGIFSAWLAEGMRSDMAAYLEKMSEVSRGLTAELVRRCQMKNSFKL